MNVDHAGKNVVFIVGSPRSGTSWLARLMGAHDDVVATQETELLNRYCAPWYDAWDDQLPADQERWERHRHRGLPAVLTTEEFDDRVVGFATGIYDKLLSLKPAARVVVDKNPSYSLHIPLIRRMFPDAGILHIVRDGRDVAASMLAASRGWGADWAPAQVRLAAQTWRTNVEAAATAAGSGRYLEARYEDLRADGPRALADCFGFAGVVTSPDDCAHLIRRVDGKAGSDAVAADSFVWSGEVVKRFGGAPAEPQGFAGSSPGWRDAWSTRDRLDFDDVAGDLLRALGYEPGRDWAAATRAQSLRAAARRRGAATMSRLGWRTHMMLGRRGLYVQLGRVTPYGRREPR